MSGSFGLNFILSIFLQFSLSEILGILEFLQIVTHMPYLIQNLPSNYKSIIKKLDDVA